MNKAMIDRIVKVNRDKEAIYTFIDGKKTTMGEVLFGLKDNQYIEFKNGNHSDYRRGNIIIRTLDEDK